MLENRMITEEIDTKKVYGVCEQCGEDIYYGDDIVIDQITGNTVHEFCRDGYIDDFIDSNFIDTIAEEDSLYED